MAIKSYIFLLIFFSITFAGEKTDIPWNGTADLLKNSDPKNNSQLPLAFNDAKPHFADEIGEKKSPALAFGLSLVLPGAGQYYNKNYWRTALYSGIEILSWTMVAVYNGKGDDADSRFRQFADTHWDEVIYWAKVYQLAANQTESGGYPDLPLYGWDVNGPSSVGVLPDWITNGFYNEYLIDFALRNYLREIETTVAIGFTHFLPATKTQQYYEMIGKYSVQFGNAWDDADFNEFYNGYIDKITPNNKEYYDMRNLSNDYYDIAGNWLSVILINHLVSAMDGLLTAKSNNRKIELSYVPKFIDGKLVNSYAVNIHF